MAVAFDNVSPDTASAAGTTSLTSTAWAVAGSNRVALGFICTGDVTGQNPTGMKWRGSAGDALTQIGSTVSIGTHAKLSAWRLAGPSAESNTAFGNWAATQGEACIGMLSYTGVDQVTPVGTAVSATGANDGSGNATATVNVTTNIGDLVVACAFTHNTSAATGPLAAPAGGSTGRYDVEGAQIGSFAAVQVIELVATGTTTAMTVNFTSSDTSPNGGWGIIAFVVNAAAGGGAGPPDPRRLATGRRAGTVQGRALFEALQTLEYVFSAGIQASISAADGSSTGSAAGTVAVGAATQTADASSTGSAAATVAVGVATQKADATSAGDASATVANSNQTVALATPLYPDPRYLTYGRLLGTPLMRAQAVLNWVIAPTAVVASQFSTADGSSTGAATAVAVGASSQTADFSSAGSAAGTIAVGASTQKADFTAAGVAVPIAVGASVTRADASSTAGATAIAISASKQAADAFSQAGSTPIAVGAASQKADATSTAGSGASTIMVPTTPFSAADGSSAGSATAVGTGASTASGDGLVIASAVAVAVSQATQAAAASSAGSAAGTTADASAPSPPIVVTLPTGITLEGGGAAQKWLHAKGDKKRRMARIERQDMLDMIDMAEFAPQVQAYFAGKGGLPHAAR